MAGFEYRHVVGFQETNFTGNVYFASHLGWQGRCRELFLREHCPQLLDKLGDELCLVTTRCSCEYFAELKPFDEVLIRMTLGRLAQNRATLHFDYFRVNEGGEELVARGQQEISAMRRQGEELVTAPMPQALLEAAGSFTAAPP